VLAKSGVLMVGSNGNAAAVKKQEAIMFGSVRRFVVRPVPIAIISGVAVTLLFFR
jgi:hypothetical protein